MKKEKLLLILIFGLITVFEVNSQVPSTNGLVGWWPFNGNANDESGNNWNGTVNGATLTYDRFGIPNSAYRFDGDDFIETNKVGPLGSSSRSISFWAKTENNNEHIDILSYGTSAPGAVFEAALNNNCEGLTLDISGAVTTFSAIVSDTEWHHYVITFNNTEGSSYNGVDFWQDGALLGTACHSGSLISINTGSTTNATIGCYMSKNLRFFKGELDDIAFWNRVITADEIESLYRIQTCYNVVQDTVTEYVTVYDTIVSNVTIYDTVFISVTDTLFIDAVILGLTPPNNINTIKIYPNPTFDYVSIEFGDFTKMIGYSIKIINSSGQEVYSEDISQQETSINLSTWSGKGIYFVQIIDPDDLIIEIRKLVLR